MIKFFRKIRQKLLSENRFTKYLLYAIGEILLVVIGILIALQVNNLNEQRKANEREQKYLVAIKNELNNNLKVIDREQGRLMNALDAQRKIIKLIDSGIDTINEKDLSHLFVQGFGFEMKLMYQNGVFVELLNSGGIKDISNDSIRHQIASWEGKMVNVRKQEKEVEDERQLNMDYVLKSGDYDFRTVMDNAGLSSKFRVDVSKKHNSNKPFLKSQVSKNLLGHYFIVGNALHDTYYPELETNIKLLLKLVEEELND